MNGPASGEVLRCLEAAVEDAKLVERIGDAAAKARADDHLRSSVDRARDVGMAWGRIGDILGIARGNAYQRYRRRP